MRAFSAAWRDSDAQRHGPSPSARRAGSVDAASNRVDGNPLAPICAAIELLGRRSAAPRELEITDRHTRHLARLVDDLLDISRVTHGHIELRSEQVSLVSVLERAAEMAGPLLSRRQHTLEVASAVDIALKGDPVRLTQVFANLLTNAAKFTPPGGHVSVGVEPAPDRRRAAPAG